MSAGERQGTDAARNYHTHRLKLLVGDIGAAAISGLLIAPSVTLIDRAVVEKLAGGESLGRCLYDCSIKALRKPWQFITSPTFRISWILYAATYAVSNSSKTIAEGLETSATAASTFNFAATMVVNVPLGIWKDMSFARIFGSPLPQNGPKCASPVRAGVPGRAIGTFLLRDGVTIFGSFTLAPALTAVLPDTMFPHEHTKAMITQMTLPVLSQLVATPVHLLGLDLHSRPDAVDFRDRLSRIRRDIYPTTVIRCIRIIPAFGIGCIVNSDLQTLFHSKVNRESYALGDTSQDTKP